MSLVEKYSVQKFLSVPEEHAETAKQVLDEALHHHLLFWEEVITEKLRGEEKNTIDNLHLFPSIRHTKRMVYRLHIPSNFDITIRVMNQIAQKLWEQEINCCMG